MTAWKNSVVSADMPVKEAIARIDASGIQAALVLDAGGRLSGVLTDGDVRRAILRGQSLDAPTSEVMNKNATSAPAATPREEMLALMRRKGIHHLPLLDETGRVVDLVTSEELVGAVARPNWVVLMAGGLGTRLRPLTENFPKPLLAVGGKPILESILESFAEQGFKQIFLSVNYKAEMIQSHFGAGERWGVRVDYLQESTRLGTAGALSLLPSMPSAPMIVMNGDLLTRANFDGLLAFHRDQGAAATMAVREYDYQVPYGVVRLDGARITAIEEKPLQRYFINAGIYVLSPEVLRHLPAQGFFDMPSLFEKLIAAGETTAAYPLREYWLDVGQRDEFERAQKEWVGDGG